MGSFFLEGGAADNGVEMVRGSVEADKIKMCGESGSVMSSSAENENGRASETKGSEDEWLRDKHRTFPFINPHSLSPGLHCSAASGFAPFYG